MAHNTGVMQAQSVAAALTLAEIDGKKGHGISRVPSYAGQAKSGKVNGHALPEAHVPKPSVLAIDARYGFAYPAFDLMMERLPDMARKQGIAMAGVTHSHHFGVAGHHVERAADMGLVALLFGNTPAAIAPWGGKTPIFGTNPIAFAAPIDSRAPMVIDLATSVAARGSIMAAHQGGEDIPEGWALDAEGRPTTDAAAALEGSMSPMAEAKGAALALMIEVLAAALTGAGFGNQASSFFETEGPAPNVGQLMLMIDPGVMTEGLAERLAGLADDITDDGGRLPGSGRMARRNTAAKDGVDIADGILETVRQLADG
jgi:(2R)-3-sulfolactate dehydrogenase (NADP+)